MLYREIIAVCSQIHTKHINVELWVLNLVVHIVTSVLYRNASLQTSHCYLRRKKTTHTHARATHTGLLLISFCIPVSMYGSNNYCRDMQVLRWACSAGCDPYPRSQLYFITRAKFTFSISLSLRLYSLPFCMCQLFVTFSSASGRSAEFATLIRRRRRQ